MLPPDRFNSVSLCPPWPATWILETVKPSAAKFRPSAAASALIVTNVCWAAADSPPQAKPPKRDCCAPVKLPKAHGFEETPSPALPGSPPGNPLSGVCVPEDAPLPERGSGGASAVTVVPKQGGSSSGE